MASHQVTAQRSYTMSRIRSKDTSPELRVRSLMHRAGYRYSLHVKTMPGAPDIVMRRYRTVVFVNGCFWHQHQGCRIASKPKTNTDYWQRKFKRTADRDRRTKAELQQDGWTVLVIWECQTRNEESLQDLLAEVLPPRLPRNKIMNPIAGEHDSD